MKLWISAVALITLCASSVFAQNVLRVPEDYITIQDAVNAASPGDTIRVGPGSWCGAAVTKRLTILGEGEPTITACTAPKDETGKPTGFLLNGLAAGSDPSGTTIRHFNFSGLHSGIWAIAANYVTIEHNTMQLAGAPSAAGVRSRYGGSFWTVSHNIITIEDTAAIRTYGQGIYNLAGSGWIVTHNTITGTGLRGGIYFYRPTTFVPLQRSLNNYAAFNRIEGAVDWFGIGITGQDGAVITNNKILVPSSAAATGMCRAWGIEVSNNGPVLTTINSIIVDNDTRGTAIGIIVLLDDDDGPGNSAGMVLRGNFGTLALNQAWQPCDAGEITHIVKSRAVSTLIVCDAAGVCTIEK